jgi:hypothetical protein
VDDPSAVRVVEPVTRIDDVPDRLFHAQDLFVTDQVRTGRPLDELHDDVVALRVRVLA